MVLPRWTAYVALAGIAILLASGIPRRVTPAIDAPHIVDPTYPRLVVLGIDGLDPDILREVEKAHENCQIGSYPFFREGRVGANFVVRSTDETELAACVHALSDALSAAGYDFTPGGI